MNWIWSANIKIRMKRIRIFSLIINILSVCFKTIQRKLKTQRVNQVWILFKRKSIDSLKLMRLKLRRFMCFSCFDFMNTMKVSKSSRSSCIWIKNYSVYILKRDKMIKSFKFAKSLVRKRKIFGSKLYPTLERKVMRQKSKSA